MTVAPGCTYGAYRKRHPGVKRPWYNEDTDIYA
jgi:hypothetical protein